MFDFGRESWEESEIRDHRIGSVIAAALALLALWGAISYANACGVERWGVKVASDLPVGIYPQPISATIAALSAIPAPVNPIKRVSPVETAVFSLDATMVLIKHEADGDYHIVLRDDDGSTMIVEAPDPACATDSYVLDAITSVRSAIDEHFRGPLTGRKRTASPVTVTGIGFWDRCHGQEGRAANCVELHPLLGIEFR